MATTVWNKGLTLGEPTIDQEHRELAALVDDLCNATMPPYEMAILDWRVHRLTAYTLAHFAAEEDMMRATGYPNTETHALRHRVLIAQLSMVRAALTEGVFVWNREATERLIRSWLVMHIVKCDRPFAAHLHHSS